MQNNQTTRCTCGFDGNSYCEPPLNSSVFDFLYESCQQNNGTLNDTSVESYASLLLDYYPYVQNIPDCVNNIFEVAAIGLLASQVPGVSESPVTEEDDDSGLWMGLGLWVSLQLIV